MAHWDRVLGDRILHVDYEALVDDQETVSRRIIGHLGLDWDDRCLRFYESGRAVTTLSRDQVNRPIYRTRVGRHHHFEKHLGALREVLRLP